MNVHGRAGRGTRSAQEQQHSDKRRQPAPDLRFSAQPRAGNSQVLLFRIHTYPLSSPACW